MKYIEFFSQILMISELLKKTFESYIGLGGYLLDSFALHRFFSTYLLSQICRPLKLVLKAIFFKSFSHDQHKSVKTYQVHFTVARGLKKHV